MAICLADGAQNLGSRPKAQQTFVLDAVVQDQSAMLARVQMYDDDVVPMLIGTMRIWLTSRYASGRTAPVGGR